MTLDEIDALMADTSSRLGLEPPPITPEELSTPAQPVSFREGDAMRRNRSNKQRSDRYMGEVREYLGKVRRGRSTRAVDPQHHAFSDESEMLRQVQTINKANRFDARMPR